MLTDAITTVDDLVSGLLTFPPEIEIITEAIHSSSQTMDSRHFAEEFLRRKRLADKGIVDAASTSSPATEKAAGGAGGWSEVAKKGGAEKKEDGPGNSAFKVVAAKKKGGKR